MTEFKLDRKQLKSRYSGSIVIGLNGAIRILIPLSKERYINIITGAIWSSFDVRETPDWTIRPGDRATFKTARSKGKEGIYKGFSGSTNTPFLCEINLSHCGQYEYISPLFQESPEKVRIAERIDKLKKELAELEKTKDGME